MFQKATRQATKLKLAITGPSGAGKTFSALRLARGLVGPGGRIAVIDTENRSASLYSDRHDFDVLNVEPPFSEEKFVAGIKSAVDAGYDAVIVDSGSHFWEGVLEYKDSLDRRGGNSFTNWGDATRKYKSGLFAFLQSNIHTITCLRSKMEYVVETDMKGKSVPRKVGLAPVFRDGGEYEFTIVFDVAMDHHAAVSKDRTGMFSDRIFQITEQTGEQIATWLAGAPVGALAGAVEQTEPTASAPAPNPAPARTTGSAGWSQRALKEHVRVHGSARDRQPSAAAPSAPAPDAIDMTPPAGSPGDLLRRLEAAIAGHEPQANAWLLANAWIKDGQTFRDLALADPKRAESIVQRSQSFIRTVTKAQPQPVQA